MNPKPTIIFHLWLEGRARAACAQIDDGHTGKVKRLYWRVTGWLLTELFAWWWDEGPELTWEAFVDWDEVQQ